MKARREMKRGLPGRVLRTVVAGCVVLGGASAHAQEGFEGPGPVDAARVIAPAPLQGPG